MKSCGCKPLLWGLRANWGSGIQNQSPPRLWKLVTMDEIWVGYLDLNASISYLIQILARLTNPQNKDKKKKKYTSSRFLCLVGKNEANTSQEAVWFMRRLIIVLWFHIVIRKNVDVQYKSCTLTGEEFESPEDQTFDRVEHCQNSLSARWSQNHTCYLWCLVMG